MNLNVGNSDSVDGSAASWRTSELRRFWGYEVNGCVCGGVNTGVALSDLCGNTAPARWRVIGNNNKNKIQEKETNCTLEKVKKFSFENTFKPK